MSVMEQSNNYDPRRVQVKVKQTVPRSGTWLHSFQVSKATVGGPGNGCLLAECRVSPKTQAKDKLLCVVKSVLLTGSEDERPGFGKRKSFLNF